MFVKIWEISRRDRRKIHGEPHKAGDLVWLLNPAVPNIKAKKFHNPWSSPCKVTDRVAYKLQNTLNHHLSVIHFNGLNLCSPNICIPQNVPKASEATVLPVQLPPAPALEAHAELVEEGDEPLQDAVEELPAPVPRQYPDRLRQPPQ